MNAKQTQFKNAIVESLKFMKQNPEYLERNPNELLSKLKDYMKTKGQSSANEVKAHEACIAEVFETNGFKLSPRKVIPKEDGTYYWYQPDGSQRCGDFLLFWVLKGEKQSEIIVDAKHTNSESIYLNDGWFNEDTIYIVSYTKSMGRGITKRNLCLIGLGKDIPTEHDSEIMEFYNTIKREMNQKRKDKKPDYLSVYIRFANQYSTKQFTDDYTENRFNKTVSWLLPSDE